MIILSFDTSFNRCSVAIHKDDNLLSSAYEYSNSKQAEKLFELIELVLKNAKLSYNDIDYLVTTQGPGSFTGIRVGLSAARGILIASPNISAISISNFEAIYFQAFRQVKFFDYIVVLINAYREQLYMQIFSSIDCAKPELIDVSNLSSIINSLEGIKVCAGNASCFAPSNFIILYRLNIPDARYLGRLGYKKILQNNFSLSLEPLYIKTPDVNVQKS